jgi:hypothetical protein
MSKRARAQKLPASGKIGVPETSRFGATPLAALWAMSASCATTRAQSAFYFVDGVDLGAYAPRAVIRREKIEGAPEGVAAGSAVGVIFLSIIQILRYRINSVSPADYAARSGPNAEACVAAERKKFGIERISLARPLTP